MICSCVIGWVTIRRTLPGSKVNSLVNSVSTASGSSFSDEEMVEVEGVMG
jgi:hypothetical protein